MKRDKENDVVILERMRYVEGIHKIIDDCSKFKILDEAPTLLRKGQLERFLRKLNKQQTPTDKIYNAMNPKVFQPAGFTDYLSCINLVMILTRRLFVLYFPRLEPSIIISQNILLHLYHRNTA